MNHQSEQDDLERFISQNREEFDFREPDPELWQKVIGETQPTATPPSALTTWLWRAAAVVVILAAGMVMIQNLPEGAQLALNDSSASPNQNEPEATQEVVIPELVEAEAYYSSQLAQMQGELNTYATAYPDLREEASFDLAELDSAYIELKRDLKEDIANEEILHALIQNYRIKLQILEEILEQIKKLENNQNQDENKELTYS